MPRHDTDDTGRINDDSSMSVSPDLLDEVIRRVVEVARPLRVVLFGSAAKGTMRPDSDLDLLVVVPDGTHRRRTANRIYNGLCGLGYPKDVIVVTEKDVSLYGENPSLIIKPALGGGRELYRVS